MRILDSFMTFAIVVCFVVLIVVEINFINKKDYWMAGTAMALMIILGLFYVRGMTNPSKTAIPKIKVIKRYIEMMEEQYSISILPNWSLYKDETTRDQYIILLKDVDEETSHIRYFPFECNKFEYVYGRGTGSIKYNVSEVNSWLLQNSKMNIKEELYADLLEKSKRETNRAMYGTFDVPRDNNQLQEGQDE